MKNRNILAQGWLKLHPAVLCAPMLTSLGGKPHPMPLSPPQLLPKQCTFLSTVNIICHDHDTGHQESLSDSHSALTISQSGQRVFDFTRASSGSTCSSLEYSMYCTTPGVIMSIRIIVQDPCRPCKYFFKLITR